jgi:NADPH2:quinone reductase
MSSANGNGTPKSPLVRNGSQATENGTSGGKKIKAVVLTSTGSGSDYSNLKLKDEDYPTVEGVAGKEEFISVRVKAAGLNFAELMQRQGLYRPSNKCPYTPGFEAAGIVEQVGSAVTDFKVDDR